MNGTFHATSVFMVVDTGTTLAYLSEHLAGKINGAIDGAEFISELGLWVAPCGATPPPFSIRINGTDFTISGSELILQPPDG